MWKLRFVWLGLFRRDSEHKTEGGAKRAAAKLHQSTKWYHTFEIYAPDGTLHLVSGPGNGWRLKWKEPK